MDNDYKPCEDDITMVQTPVGRIQRTVVCACNRYDTEEHGELLVCSARHFDPLMNRVLDALNIDGFSRHQGFIDQWGNWMDREEGKVVALASGQKLRDPDIKDWLFSENLY